MTMHEPVRIDRDATVAFAQLFHALSDASRLTVLQHLASGEHRVRDLVEHLGLAQSTVSKHVASLVECGLIDARAEGRATWYALARPALLAELVVAAERLLGAGGGHRVLHAHLTDAARSSGEAGEEGPHGSRA
ncbi:metalloregulator ArsR/SmtB family transcription factor [Agrococcus sp. UYP10]|uniref:ArsR/SmtB family transcription factor n=1 Tax=Agrococcus sp. UYP10 TaxID=1756355 RepID=UPI003396DDD0